MNASHAASRSVLLALVIGFGSASACIDESLVENKDCKTDADCFNSQECLFTGYQSQLLEPTGWCRPEGEGCVDGQQPGCACEVDGLQLCCSGTTVALSPHMHPSEGCICVLDGDTDFPPEPDASAGCITP